MNTIFYGNNYPYFRYLCCCNRSKNIAYDCNCKSYNIRYRSVLEEKQKYSKNAVANIKKEITLLEEKKARVDDLVIEGTFEKETYTRKKGEIENYLISKKIQLDEYDCTLIKPSELIEYGKKFLYNLSSLWKDLDTPRKV